MNAYPSALRVVPRPGVVGQVAAPPSKSVTNRLLVLAALADGTSQLHGALDSDDTAAMRGCISAFGAHVDGVVDMTVKGTGGRPATPGEPIDCRLSGTTIRFATAAAALAAGPVTLTGALPLQRRPLGPLLAALERLGVSAQSAREGLPPVTISGGGLAGGEVVVDASTSSQFVSALLHVAPYAAGPVTVTATGLGARAYVDLTVASMREWGAVVEFDETPTWRVQPGGYRSRAGVVGYDASAAAHLFAVAASTGGRVTVTNADDATLQPDAALPTVLEQFGCRVEREAAALSVSGPDVLRPVDVELAAMPDQVTTVACLAALADGRSTIRGVGIARGHETDRLAALALELGKLGVEVTEEADGLAVMGGTARGGVRLVTHDDHRLAMAFAAIAARVPDVVIVEPGCVSKTYPRFWDDLTRLGLEVVPV